MKFLLYKTMKTTLKIGIITLITTVSFFVKAEEPELFDSQQQEIITLVASSTQRNLATYGKEGIAILEAIEKYGYAGPLEAHLSWNPFANPNQRQHALLLESPIGSQLNGTGEFGMSAMLNENGNFDLIPNGTTNEPTFPTWNKKGPKAKAMSDTRSKPSSQKLYVLSEGMFYTGMVNGPRFFAVIPLGYKSPSNATNAEIDSWVTLVMSGLKERGIFQNSCMSDLTTLSYLMEVGLNRQFGATTMHANNVEGVYSIASITNWGDPRVGAGPPVIFNPDGTVSGSSIIESWFVYKDRLFFRTIPNGNSTESLLTVAIPKDGDKRAFCFEIDGTVYVALKHWKEFIEFVGGPQVTQQ